MGPLPERQRDALRIRATLLTIIVVALGLGFLEIGMAVHAQQPAGLWVLASSTTAFGLVLLLPLGLVARDRLEPAVFVTCTAVLGIQAIYLVVFPRAFAAVAIVSFVVVALALSFVEGRHLLALTLASWGIAMAAAVLGTVGRPLVTIPPEADAPVVLGSSVAAVTMGMVLLWQFAKHMAHALAEARAAHADLSLAHRQLRDLEVMKSRFINAAAHELNTPLTPVMIQLDLLKTSRKTGRAVDEAKSLQVLERNLVRINGLVQEMLQVARLQGGRLAVRRQRYDLDAVLREAVDDFAGPAKARGLTLSFQGVGPLELEGDSRRVAQVASNLLSNAVRLTPSGGSITVDLHRDADAVVASVTDTGAGLTEEQQGALFQPFVRLHEDTPGTGLGLYICKGLIEEMGGHIGVASPGTGKGATFSFRLPGPSAPSAPGPAFKARGEVAPPWTSAP